MVNISVDRISKSFGVKGGKLRAIDSVSFTINRGESVTIVGPNGCGKSTLLKVIGGLIRPTEGRVLINGHPTVLAQKRSEISYVFQNPALLPWRTVAENVRLPLEIIHKGTLSFNPPILLMDEPFSAVDEMSRNALNMYLLDLWNRLKFTVVYVTHSVREAVFLADKIVVLSERLARIKKNFSVCLARPRTTETKYFPAYTRLIKAVSSSLWGKHFHDVTARYP
ncbi:MAG: ABC transporter, ATPase subunit [Candidatus Collierbacteria bacterium GW2011_GWA2_46_26]|uniref:ABC transporter, ATPase subunit n=1 Tax=Candidatus Collierbacteria bacterium GW2011_GWA2_46_26 TaxID=1618381 RepID=A0A0G1RR20_9BACT|nr:MAG: ABC transporter, ATPase subunit [Candidatus Collierbacteria bacterium GW2011_GWA2_46_26]